ncbi:hypothetical protein TWF281_002285 [Arthrobotrys megalospora]
MAYRLYPQPHNLDLQLHNANTTIHLPTTHKPHLLTHPTSKISIITKNFLTNHILNTPLPWIAGQTLRLTENSIITHPTLPRKQYTLLPVVISSTPYFLPVLVVEDIHASLPDIGAYIPEHRLKEVDGIISTAGLNINLEAPKKLPNFNWIPKQQSGSKNMGIVLEVFVGNIRGEGVGVVYCGPGSRYNDVWRTGRVNGRNKALMVFEGVKKALVVIEQARKIHGYPVSFAVVCVNCGEVVGELGRRKGQAIAGSCKNNRKKEGWKGILEDFQKVKGCEVEVEFCELKKEREVMIEGMVKRRLELRRVFKAPTCGEVMKEEDAIDQAFYPHCLESRPFASIEREITRDDVIGALPQEISAGVASDDKETAPRRSSRQAKRAGLGKEEVKRCMPTMVPSKSRFRIGRPEDESMRMSENVKAWGRTREKPSGGLPTVYQDIPGDLTDAKEWKQILDAHLATGEPLRYPWAPTGDYYDTEELEDLKIVKKEEDDEPIETFTDPWDHFQHDLQAFRENFEVDWADDDDAMDMSADESSEHGGGGFRLPRLYRSGGPSPESMDGATTPRDPLQKIGKEPAIFEEDVVMKFEMPELEIEDSGVCGAQVPVEIESRGRNIYSPRVPLHEIREVDGSNEDEGTWSLEELETIDDIMGGIYDIQDDDADDEKEGKGCLQDNDYAAKRARSRSLSRLRRRIEDVEIGDEVMEQLQPRRRSARSPVKRTQDDSYTRTSRSPTKRVTRVSRSPVKGRAPRSPMRKGVVDNSGLGKPVDRNMAFKELARNITQRYELRSEKGVGDVIQGGG